MGRGRLTCGCCPDLQRDSVTTEGALSLVKVEPCSGFEDWRERYMSLT